MTRIAFATHEGLPHVTDDDQLLVDALRPYKVRVESVRWDAPIDWGRYDVVLPRSTWDFHHRLPEFRRWLANVDATRALLLNPLRVLEWNSTKRYMEDLRARGIRIVPTTWVTAAAGEALPSVRQLRETLGADGSVVVKPTVSASAHDTWIARGVDVDGEDARFQRSLANAPYGLMVQPFLPQIQTRGEWSLVFIRGQFSHAVLKRPADGDFRVQQEHGGRSTAATPPAGVLEDAARVLAEAAACTGQAVGEILYARVDGVEQDGRLLLMEFEALEPTLYFTHAPLAATRMAAAIQGALGRAAATRGLAARA